MTMPPHPILCFGELLLRLSPPGSGHLFQQPRLDAHFGGAEANVAVALARLGVPAALCSVVPDDAIGDGALDSVRRAGVDVSRIARTPGRLGLYFLTHGAGLRPSSIVYDRLNSVFAARPRAAWDWPALLDGVARLHLSGIIPAIGPDAALVSMDAMQAANAMAIPVSFDGNFRASMWARWCDDPAPILARHVAHADLLFGNHRDIALMLGRPIPGEGADRRRHAATLAFDRFDRLRMVASTSRDLVTGDHHRLAVRLDTREAAHETPAVDVTGIVDRIGTGDAFVAGVLARLPEGLAAAAQTGLAMAALHHATPGDQSFITPADAAAFAMQAGDVRR